MSLELGARVAERDVDASFEINTGQTVALLGENGAGKSTLLAVAAGLLRPERGRVVLDGQPLLDTDNGVDLPPHRRGVALLSQDPLLFPHLTVLDNVAFGPRSRGVPRRDAQQQAEHWLSQVGALDLAGRKPGGLSGGQAQRVAIARALAADPRLLLLDEPMASLDVEVTPALRQTLRGVLADRTAVIVTHDVLDALLLADRVVVLENGRIVEDGDTRVVLTRPRSRFAARLAGVNLLAGTWTGDHVELDDGGVLFGMAAEPLPQPGDRVVATFKPHAVAVYRDLPQGSPRNSFGVRIDELEPLGDLIRLRTEQLSADVTLQAVADLDLTPGTWAAFSVKATEIDVYRLA
ncbi:sulfate/molybdate ABC transporter ATP-binding protein [Nocardioides marmorisolisilvae]|uniref:ATP-binding cassette domain-containing protein n=1 Tax=Nocardioides marmorisolisilvae TaxID=1542737 RepID=A0A3N0DZ30_9ACTN|nr:ATP-binding cassette domain-containing protein [Nocardioides marmorisolisilvae]RNL80821.1 ATP-binding cassette domain-containing protein [Nocardioides marmorisolisilvae]